jgi:stress-induced morphogen
MKNLLQSFKPKYIKLINESNYKFTSTKILAKLESSKFYGDLTINEVRDIYDMCNINALRVSAWDYRFGDNLLIDEND